LCAFFCFFLAFWYFCISEHAKMRFTKYILSVICTIICVACATTDNSTPELTKIYKPRYAKGFSIATNGTDTLIVIINPFQGSGNSSEQIVLDKPMQRIVCTSSSHVAFLDKLGEWGRIVGVSGLRFITTQNLSSAVRDIGYDTSLDYEAIVALRSDIVLLYGITGQNKAICSKLSELGLRYAYIGEHAEVTPLAKSEWLVAFGYMCGEGDKAVAVFDSIASRYSSLAEQASKCEERPKVMLNAPYQDIWYVPSDDSYMVSLIADAAGEYVCRGDSSHTSRPIDIETAYRKVQEADIWLNTNQMGSLQEIRSSLPRFANVGAMTSGRVFNNTRRTNAAGGSDFWESGVVDADIVLKDMIEILHPELLDHTLYYYKQLQ